MTPNSSLRLSLQIRNLMHTDLLQQIDESFPFELVASFKAKEKEEAGTMEKTADVTKKKPVKRDRVYNDENTLLTMLVTAVQEDKSLQQSVITFSKVFEKNSAQVQQLESVALSAEKQLDLDIKKTGRPKLYRSKMPKSATRPLSLNTASFAVARQRLNYDLVKEVFNYSKDFKGLKQLLWYGMQSFNTDGTYVQMQDSKELREKYYVREGDGAYPQALLQAIVCHGTGQITEFKIGTRHQSELELVSKLITQLPAGSLLLADDLYSSYAIFSLMQKAGCHLIVPGKRDRNYTVIEQIAPGDEIVQLKRTPEPKWRNEDWQLPKTLLMRRLSYLSPIDGKTECILYTTLVDKGIPKSDMVVKYTSRWDIEITIREIKTLMDINVVRSKSEDMVDKEITIALTAYNMIRKIITQSVEQTEFPPQKDIFQEFAETYKDVLIDKKGRVYQRWSPGRYGKAPGTDQ